ncbi:hypothetical protein SELMODRAFT_448377 [Selaginella moellendorffii]|uniref:DEAD/DEAH box helicase domain-containing protein n=1 Tax=Selaginella moellendorffii TaxID=88036 RepID=D8T6U7_SELML|nr:uncharacterized protein C3orf26 homolog [Selaginella moellendorffii]EFJ07629.1 hypothetical protein SELMODRAFT_448377 [Selaginella moellendorffii]|eukprot:XP_002991331.1 uncharacterized protein C3orf26 homolog [Selaginella moellendorffii]
MKKTKKRREHRPIGVATKSKITKKSNAPSKAAAAPVDRNDIQFKSPRDQSSWFFSTFRAVHSSVLSSLEMGALPDDAMVEIPSNQDHCIENLASVIKGIVGSSWESSLCSGALGDLEPGSPIVLIVSSSAVRCVSLLKNLASLTKECKPGKLFAKHLKVEEQVSALKQRVNIAAGTPSRLKKLIDIGALGLSRLSLLVFDMHKDAKGLTLFTVPQVRKELWELYRLHFHNGVVEGRLRLCLY